MSPASPSSSSRGRPAVASGRTRHASVAARGLLAAAERDLQQIILDIHDGPVQDIFGALSQIQTLRHRADVQADAALVLDRVAASLERALGEIRNFIGAFRPPEFERRPLGAILEQLVVQHESLTGATVDFTMTTPLPDQVPLSLKISLYRILQEALANATRHAGVTHFEVSARANRRHIVVQVRDRGKGFDVAKVLKKEIDVGVAGGHFGLRGMRDRVAIMNGKLSITSGRAGTVVTIQLPIS
ncbi:MAG TPA: ATP-binding protein [Gemmatimonadaceae bacterium]|nr:ATP-binding protein [Gemmatimonadaceae bacterium]